MTCREAKRAYISPARAAVGAVPATSKRAMSCSYVAAACQAVFSAVRPLASPIGRSLRVPESFGTANAKQDPPHVTVQVAPGIVIRALYAGHVLGAAMMHLQIDATSILYTGDHDRKLTVQEVLMQDLNEHSPPLRYHDSERPAPQRRRAHEKRAELRTLCTLGLRACTPCRAIAARQHAPLF